MVVSPLMGNGLKNLDVLARCSVPQVTAHRENQEWEWSGRQREAHVGDSKSGRLRRIK